MNTENSNFSVINMYKIFFFFNYTQMVAKKKVYS